MNFLLLTHEERSKRPEARIQNPDLRSERRETRSERLFVKIFLSMIV
jgi:hypothetical protein